MGTISTKLAREIINTVGSQGIPPESGVQYFSVGLEGYLSTLEREYISSFIKEGGASFKMVIGMYGGGKTHFLYCVRNIAWKHNYIVAYLSLSPEHTPLYRLDLVYKSLVANLTCPQKGETTGQDEKGIESIIRAWFDSKYREVANSGVNSDNIKEELKRYVEKLGCYQSITFRNAISNSFLSLLDKKDRDFIHICQWLKCEGYDKFIHQRYGILQPIDKSSVFPMIKSLVHWIREIGYSGLIILMDEAERVPSLGSKQKELLLNNLRELIDECGQGGFSNTMIFYAVPDESFLEGKTQVYEALRQRVATVFKSSFNPTGVKINLEKLPIEAIPMLVEIGKKLCTIYEQAYEVNLEKSAVEKTIELVAKACYERRFADVSYRRLFVQKIIHAFHIISNVGMEVPLKTLELETPSPAE